MTWQKIPNGPEAWSPTGLDDWILYTGFWDDQGWWIDDPAVWQDYPRNAWADAPDGGGQWDRLYQRTAVWMSQSPGETPYTQAAQPQGHWTDRPVQANQWAAEALPSGNWQSQSGPSGDWVPDDGPEGDWIDKADPDSEWSEA